MKKICVYGKGGIGKSTTVANVAAALAEEGLRVAVVGCDPKADSTRCLMGRRIPSVLDQLRTGSAAPVSFTGYRDILCVESGGPEPGTGCAGRGIVAALREIQDRGLLEDRDVVLYDVLGDVVCGGFAMPIRGGYAREVFIVSSGEMMSLYAANNIAQAIRNFGKRGYARLTGLILNAKNIENEREIVEKACGEIGTDIVQYVPRSPEIQKAESQGGTVFECLEESAMQKVYAALAEEVLRRTQAESK